MTTTCFIICIEGTDWEVNEMKSKIFCIFLLTLLILASMIPLTLSKEQKIDILDDDITNIDVQINGVLNNVPTNGIGIIQTTITEEDAIIMHALKDWLSYLNQPGELKPVIPGLFEPVGSLLCPCAASNVMNIAEIIGDEVLINQHIDYFVDGDPVGAVDEVIFLKSDFYEGWSANISLNGFLPRPPLPDPPIPDSYMTCLHQEEPGKIVGICEQSLEYADGTVFSWEIERIYQYDSGNELIQDEIVLTKLDEITINENKGDLSMTAHSHYEPAVTLKSLSGGLGCNAIIKNYGMETVNDIECSFDLEASFMLFGDHVEDTFTLSSGEETSFNTGLILGIGPGTTQVTIGDMIVQQDCFIIGPFVIMTD